jgi:hypothetical protein
VPRPRSQWITLSLCVGVGVGLVSLIAAVVLVNGSRVEAVDAAAAPAATSVTPAAPLTTGGVAPVSHDHAMAVEPGDGTSPCEVAAPSGNGGGDGSGHGERGRNIEQPLDAATQARLDEQLATATSVAKRYPTAADAKAAGYRQGAPYLPCLGAHYTNQKLVDATFDPAQPEQLLYDGNTDDSQIVGVSFLVASGPTPPDGFAGPNDPWHQHIGLCMKGPVVLGAATLTDEQCAARGGAKTTAGTMWMLHAWVVPGHASSWGTFSAENPSLGALSRK